MSLVPISAQQFRACGSSVAAYEAPSATVSVDLTSASHCCGDDVGYLRRTRLELSFLPRVNVHDPGNTTTHRD